MHVAKQLLGIIIDNVVGRLPSGLFTCWKIYEIECRDHRNKSGKQEVFELKKGKVFIRYYFIFFFTFPDNILNKIKYRSHPAWTFGLHSAN